MRSIRTALISILASPLLMLITISVSAQETRSIKIANGEVFINDRVVTSDDLPSSLDVDGLQLQYVFSGDVAPVIRVGEEFFVLEDGRLREAHPNERNDVSVIFRDDVVQPYRSGRVNGRLRARSGVATVGAAEAAARVAAESALKVREVADYDFAFPAAPAPHITMMQEKAAELQAQAQRLQQLQSHARSPVNAERMEELERAAQELTLRAEETARAAEAMPRLQVQGYLKSIQNKNEKLFQRLVDEREMEREALRLAAQIRNEERADEREERIDLLRERLHEAFDLKQQNRRHEIEALEDRLEDLQETLEERERMREDIVDRRLRELLGMSDDMKW